MISGLGAAISIAKRTWKVWVPILLISIIAVTVLIQHKRIEALKNQRDVAIVEHDRAMEQQKQLLQDIERLNTVLSQQRELEQRLEGDLANAKHRISELSDKRSDVADWIDDPLPDGLWKAAANHNPQGRNTENDDKSGGSAGAGASD